jgi:GxxExxY protein
MPVETQIPLRPISQSDFGDVAYEVVGHAFAIHKRLGSMFHESAYRNSLKQVLGQRANSEVRIRLTHAEFTKDYFIDLVVDSACPFELKTAAEIHDRHRAQLIQYLMLTDLRHGKLINFGGNEVVHEFVNCRETRESRRSFRTDLNRWQNETPLMRRLRVVVKDLLCDWGTGLNYDLYEEAITHLLGGTVRDQTDVFLHDGVVSQQNANIIAPRMALKVTCKRDNVNLYESHLRRFLEHTNMDKIFWLNIVTGYVTLTLLAK